MAVKRALIIGNGPSIWDDLMSAPQWPAIVVDEGGLRHPVPIEVWVSAWPEQLAQYIDERSECGYSMGFEAYSTKMMEAACGHKIHAAPFTKPLPRTSEASEFLACMVADYLGYEQLLLCGLGGKVRSDAVHKYWIDNYERFQHNVRSLSGWSMNMFGNPDE